MEVSIVTPKLVRVIYAVDDTDTKEKGASWVLMLEWPERRRSATIWSIRSSSSTPMCRRRPPTVSPVGVSFAVAEKDHPCADRVRDQVHQGEHLL